MAHEIYESQFYDNQEIGGRKAAWHKLSVFERLGIDREDRPYRAEEIYALFGSPRYEKVRKQVTLKDGRVVDTDKWAIVAHPDALHDEQRILGECSGDYEFTDTGIVAKLWDDEVDIEPETMMMLRKGGLLVITGKLPEYEVRGELVENYLVLSNGMDGKTSTRADVTGVRVVCANTLAAAVSRSIRHTEGSMDRLVGWMKTVKSAAEFQAYTMRDVYNILAQAPIKREDVMRIATDIYPDPRDPSITFIYKKGYEDAVNRAIYQKALMEEKRERIMELFDGDATGFGEGESQAQGTAWHALNAFTEEFTWGRTTNAMSRAESVLIGNHGAQIKKITTELIHMVPEAANLLEERRAEARELMVSL